MIEVTPTKFELYDMETKDHVANVEMFDEGAAKVDVVTVVDAQSWADVSAAIQVALSLMFATGRQVVRTTVEIDDGH